MFWLAFMHRYLCGVVYNLNLNWLRGFPGRLCAFENFRNLLFMVGIIRWV